MVEAKAEEREKKCIGHRARRDERRRRRKDKWRESGIRLAWRRKRRRKIWRRQRWMGEGGVRKEGAHLLHLPTKATQCMQYTPQVVESKSTPHNSQRNRPIFPPLFSPPLSSNTVLYQLPEGSISSGRSIFSAKYFYRLLFHSTFQFLTFKSSLFQLPHCTPFFALLPPPFFSSPFTPESKKRLL